MITPDAEQLGRLVRDVWMQTTPEEFVAQALGESLPKGKYKRATR